MDNGLGVLVGLALGILLLILVFIFCREIICSFFKINQVIELLEKIHAELKKQNDRI